jgi:hypothetical protein
LPELGDPGRPKKIICEYDFEYPGVSKADYVFFYRAFAVEDAVRAAYLAQAYTIGKDFEEDRTHAN